MSDDVPTIAEIITAAVHDGAELKFRPSREAGMLEVVAIRRTEDGTAMYGLCAQAADANDMASAAQECLQGVRQRLGIGLRQ